jgi:hypothetical protein
MSRGLRELQRRLRDRATASGHGREGVDHLRTLSVVADPAVLIALDLSMEGARRPPEDDASR